MAAAAARHAAAAYDLAAAAAEKLGQEGREYAPARDADRAHLLELIAKARLRTDGDAAYLADPNSNWMLPLRSEAGRWRVELPQALPDKEEHARAVRWMTAQAAMLRELAAEVRAGRYASVSELDKARREKTRKFAAAMLAENPALGGPRSVRRADPVPVPFAPLPGRGPRNNAPDAPSDVPVTPRHAADPDAAPTNLPALPASKP